MNAATSLGMLSNLMECLTLITPILNFLLCTAISYNKPKFMVIKTYLNYYGAASMSQRMISDIAIIYTPVPPTCHDSIHTPIIKLYYPKILKILKS